MLEVYTGYKPGRPVLLLVLCASILALTLGLAWAQALATRLLAPEYAIGDTPLLVRPPRNWRPHDSIPGRFIRYSLGGEEGENGAPVVEQSLQFVYRRLPNFVPPVEIIDELRWVDDPRRAEVTAEKIGPYDAVQVRQTRPRRFRGYRFDQINVLRVACSPRGDVIIVEYEPLLEFTPGDLELLNVICESVRLRDESVSRRSDRPLLAAGLRFPIQRDWVISAADFPDTPGVYVGGTVNGNPCWSIGIFRTWLNEHRDAEAVMRDFATTAWGNDGAYLPIAQRSRPDGVLVASVYRAPRRSHGDPVIGGSLVRRDDESAAILLVCSSEREAATAMGIADEIAAVLEISPATNLPNLENARAAGKALVETLESRGDAFLSEGVNYYARGDAEVGSILEMTLKKEERPNSSWSGGHTRFSQKNGEPEEEFRWTLGPDNRAFSASRLARGPRDTVASFTQDERPSDSDEVVRLVTVAGQARRFMIPVRENFVCPPFELAAVSWVAQQREGGVLIETLEERRSGTRTALLRPLPPDASGRRRALRIEDHWPRGMVYTFDTSLTLDRVESPGVSLRRISAGEAVRMLRRVRPAYRLP